MVLSLVTRRKCTYLFLTQKTKYNLSLKQLIDSNESNFEAPFESMLNQLISNRFLIDSMMCK